MTHRDFTVSILPQKPRFRRASRHTESVQEPRKLFVAFFVVCSRGLAGFLATPKSARFKTGPSIEGILKQACFGEATNPTFLLQRAG